MAHRLMPPRRLGIGHGVLDLGGLAEADDRPVQGARLPRDLAIGEGERQIDHRLGGHAGGLIGGEVQGVDRRQPVAGRQGARQVAGIGVGEGLGVEPDSGVELQLGGGRRFRLDGVPLAEPQQGDHRGEDIELAHGQGLRELHGINRLHQPA